MRGLRDIHNVNANPAAARIDDATFAAANKQRTAEAQRKHGERVEARQRERNAGAENGKATDSTSSSQGAAGALASMLAAAFLIDLLTAPPVEAKPKHLGMEGILSALDGEPPFLKFWARLNEHRARHEKAEATYGEAMLAFKGGKTPEGALTHFGNAWKNTRAVPSTRVERQSYHEQHLVQTPQGNFVWIEVTNILGLPIEYITPEAALVAARMERDKAAKAATG